ncbi:MAG: hypothetical protein WCI73_20035, partial [Phycisphaerae bacterium]
AVHVLTNVRQILAYAPEFSLPHWQALRKMTELSLACSRGRWLTGVSLTGSAPDVLVDLRGPQELCLDLMDDPEGVQLALQHLDRHLPSVDRFLWDPVAAGGLPTPINGEGVVAIGHVTRLDSDFLCMVSPSLGSDLLYPSLHRRIRQFDQCYWHADGPGWLTHLDWILRDDRIRGVQWVYGAGNGPAAKWIDVYRKIQAAGKAIELMPVSLDDARQVMQHLRPEGVWLKFWDSYPADAAHQFLTDVAQRANWGA